ncbi:hypothetical protein FK498_00650 [Elioraea sp. Yellowstone]|uniref:hypothetical protein n=1 Tax=Elioraea TaxID=457933 RepID=UPI00037F6647|nr:MULTISPECIES: hypothetical protein [Elioraea]TQF85232.1 hypothetical protein FK498_00650 [Elioraea sp. Yellowstone]
MLTLDLPCEPVWLDLPSGVRLRVRPIDRIVRAAAEGAALDKAKQALAEAGAPEDSPAFKTLYLLILSRLLARHAVLAWEGVGDPDGAPLAVTPEALDALLDRDDMLLAFWDRVVNRSDPVDTEGNG